MKKENIYKFLYIVAALLVVGFAIAFGVDAYKYNTGSYLGSAPLKRGPGLGSFSRADRGIGGVRPVAPPTWLVSNFLVRPASS